MQPDVKLRGNNSVRSYLDRLGAERFYGSITIKYENGAAVHIRREQNLKPSELSGTPENKNAFTNLS